LKVRAAAALAQKISAREATAAIARWAAQTDESALELEHLKKAQVRRRQGYSAMVLATADSMRPADRPVAKAAPVLPSTVTNPLPRPGSGVMRALAAELTSKGSPEENQRSLALLQTANGARDKVHRTEQTRRESDTASVAEQKKPPKPKTGALAR
jgi:hypothetical protein